MHYDFYGPPYMPPPYWAQYMAPPQQPNPISRGRRSRRCPTNNPFKMLEEWQKFQDALKKKQEEDDKNKKKPPTELEKVVGFFQWWGFMSIAGLIVGLINLKLLGLIKPAIVATLQATAN